MKEEDKQLVLVDLCARLPYGVKVTNGIYTITLTPCSDTSIIIKNEHILPYLRPMSSMTEKEENLFSTFRTQIRAMNNYNDFAKECNKLNDWLNKKGFDYRGLIEKGLAIELTKENNPYEN